MNVAFIGSKEAGYVILEQLISLAQDKMKVVICPDDKLDARSVEKKFVSVTKNNNIPLTISNKSADIYECIEKYNIDIVIVVGWYSLIDVDRSPNTSFYGIHYSLLPKYRGNAPLVWQIINGEKKLGVSFFEITNGMDEGDIIGQDLFDFGDNENIAIALEGAQKVSSSLLNSCFPLLLRGEEPRQAQDHSKASYCGLRIAEDGLINWSKAANNVHDFIRAQSQPYPGAYTIFNGQKLFIQKASVDPREIYAVAGSIVQRCENNIVIGCGEGAIIVERIVNQSGDEIIPKDAFKSLKNRLLGHEL